jgi:hypothetical protein
MKKPGQARQIAQRLNYIHGLERARDALAKAPMPSGTFLISRLTYLLEVFLCTEKSVKFRTPFSMFSRLNNADECTEGSLRRESPNPEHPSIDCQCRINIRFYFS